VTFYHVLVLLALVAATWSMFHGVVWLVPFNVYTALVTATVIVERRNRR